MSGATTGFLLEVGGQQKRRQKVKIPPKPKWLLALRSPQATGYIHVTSLTQHSLVLKSNFKCAHSPNFPKQIYLEQFNLLLPCFYYLISDIYL